MLFKLNDMIRTGYLVWSIILILCLSNCAKRGYITGGDMDTIPPVPLSFNPLNSTTHFDKKEFRVTFDEYIKLKNVNQNLIISPPMEHAPDITPMGNANKSLQVKIKDTLQPNTTYSFNFGQSITDNNEGNVLPQFKYIFSTGAYIDSLKLSGTVRTAHQIKTDNFVNIMLYDAKTFHDSTVYLQKPLYITNTLDSLTTFTIENIKEGTYYLVALKDKNNDYKFNPNQDKIAFYKDSITIPTEEQFNLSLFKSEEPFKVSRPSQISENKWYIPFHGNPDSARVSLLHNDELIRTALTSLAGKDSLQFWFPKIEADSLQLKVTSTDYEEAFSIRPRANIKTVDTLSISAKQTSVLDLNDRFTLFSKTPIDSIDFQKIAIVDKDTLPINFKTESRFKEQSFYIDFEKKESDNYHITLLPGAVTDYFGYQNDTLNFAVNTKQATDYGNLNVHLSGVNRFPIIVQILDTNEAVIAEHYSESETTIPFTLLPPKLYYLRVIYDDNKNRKWDTGYYFDRRQPEETLYYPEQIDVRANWDIEQNFNLSTP